MDASLLAFRFELAPVEKIEPWGEPDDHQLSWFGLSLGTYFIEASRHRLPPRAEEAGWTFVKDKLAEAMTRSPDAFSWTAAVSALATDTR